jgi:flagellar motor switch protein FliN/FliY
MADKSAADDILAAAAATDPAVAAAPTPPAAAPTETTADEALNALGEADKAARPRNLDLILDIPLKVTVELGRTKMVVHDLLALGQGSVIELNKLAGEPMEVLVNDKLVARGEAVVVNEKFGVRLTDIISPMERIQQLK